jgi:hypothetical protein
MPGADQESFLKRWLTGRKAFLSPFYSMDIADSYKVKVCARFISQANLYLFED